MGEHWKCEDSCKKMALSYANHNILLSYTRTTRLEWKMKLYHTSSKREKNIWIKKKKREKKKGLFLLVGQQSELLAIADMIHCHYTKLSRKINQFWRNQQYSTLHY